jgi:hypothetical protein
MRRLPRRRCWSARAPPQPRAQPGSERQSLRAAAARRQHRSPAGRRKRVGGGVGGNLLLVERTGISQPLFERQRLAGFGVCGQSGPTRDGNRGAAVGSSASMGSGGVVLNVGVVGSIAGHVVTSCARRHLRTDLRTAAPMTAGGSCVHSKIPPCHRPAGCATAPASQCAKAMQ